MAQQNSEESQANESEPRVSALDDVETLKKALAEEKERAETNLAGWQRAQADFINYKRRSEQARDETGKFASTVLMLNLLPVLDDLKRAFASIPIRMAKHDWVDGIRLIERKFRAVLEAQGLSEIEAIGEPFDPNLHEAVMQGKGKENIVVGELHKGYRLRDRVIRPSRVIVGNGEQEEKKEE